MSSGTRKRDKPGQTGTKRDRPARDGRDTPGQTGVCAFSTPLSRFVPPAGSPPVPPLVLVGRNGMRWALVGMRRHVRKDGVDSFITKWASNCKTCGLLFEVETGCTIDVSKSLALVNCPDHRGAKP